MNKNKNIKNEISKKNNKNFTLENRQDSKINIKTLKRLLKYISKYRKQFIIVVILIGLSTIATVISSVFLRSLIDDYITPLIGVLNPNFSGLLKALSVMTCVYIVGIISGLLYNRLMSVISQSVQKDIRDEMFDKMEKLPIDYFDRNSTGDIMSRYTNDTDSLAQMFSQSLPQLISSITSVLFVLIAMFFINIPLTIFVLIITMFIIYITKTIAGKSAKYFMNLQNSIGTVNGFVEEMINGSKVIKVFTHEEESIKDFNKLNDELFENNYKANKFVNILMPICGSLGNLEYVLVAIVGGIIAINFGAGITIGTLVSFLALTRSFNQPITQILNQLNSIVMAIAGATRIFELIDSKPEEDNGTVVLINCKKDKNGGIFETKENTNNWAWKTKQGELIELRGHVEFKNVVFGYGEKEILHDISLYAKPGQKIAFVGATGAGKTTITNLVNRFYEINDGLITYDGIDIKNIKKDDLRRSLGMVLQDTNLFTGTVKDNIKYGKENASDEEIIEAAKIANAHDFISMLPQGYDTVINGNGSSLSQGQRQLLSIARAALNNPPVMILDEATSSIDTRTEKIVQEGMDKLMEGRTVFVIAHRLSTVRNSKAILVMSNGKIIERGDHESLLKNKGEYYMLYTGAFELE